LIAASSDKTFASVSHVPTLCFAVESEPTLPAASFTMARASCDESGT
jgi:hypothetical protein